VTGAEPCIGLSLAVIGTMTPALAPAAAGFV
jgi:hypothetical protein